MGKRPPVRRRKHPPRKTPHTWQAKRPYALLYVAVPILLVAIPFLFEREFVVRLAAGASLIGAGILIWIVIRKPLKLEFRTAKQKQRFEKQLSKPEHSPGWGDAYGE